MDALQAIAEPVRRSLIEALAHGSRTAGELSQATQHAFGITQPAVSRHLRVLRETGLVQSTVDGQSRVYSLNVQGIDELTEWAERIRGFWNQRFDALETEISRGASAARVKEQRL